MYDDYLRNFNKITIDVNNDEFKNHVNNTLNLFDFWHRYLKDNPVKAVVASHSVYNMGLILRIAISLKIPSYLSSPNGIYYLTGKNFTKHSPTEYKKYPEIFKEVNKKYKKKFIIDAKKKLQNRFKGNNDIKILLYRNVSKDIFRNKKNLKKLNFDSDKIKILVQAHQLNDAVHVYGKNVFVDFKEWLNFLGNLSNKTNYLWLLKPHPSEFKTNMIHFDKFINKFPNFKLVNSDVSNSELIKEKINAVTTVYGSGGHEFPLFDIPVINASINNPHIGYNFNFHASNANEYKNLIYNISKLKTNKREVLKIFEYYSVRYTMDFTPIINQDSYVKKYGQNFKSEYNQIFLSQINIKRHNEIYDQIKKFIVSGDFRMYQKHI